jgi:hypothetical protein
MFPDCCRATAFPPDKSKAVPGLGHYKLTTTKYRTHFGWLTQQGAIRGEAADSSGSDLAGSELIGIWADRTDIVDSREFARQLGHQAEYRREMTDAAGY